MGSCLGSAAVESNGAGKGTRGCKERQKEGQRDSRLEVQGEG